MTCCVVGGAGFIGRTLVRHLADSGRKVIALGRSAQPALPLDPRAQYMAYEAQGTLTSVLAQAEELVDLTYASVARATFSDPLAELLANVPVSLALMQAALGQPLRRYIYLSSGGT